MFRSTRLAITCIVVTGLLSPGRLEASMITGAAINVDGFSQECTERSDFGTLVECSYVGTVDTTPADFVVSATSWASISDGEISAYAQFSTTGYYGTSPNVVATAGGTVTDLLTITGGTGVVFVIIDSELTGDFTAETRSAFPDGSFAVALAGGSYELSLQSLSTLQRCVIETVSTCSVTLAVEYGSTFTVFQSLGVNAGGSYRTFESSPVTISGVSATADASHTAKITSIFIRDADGNVLHDAQVNSSSGFRYSVNPTTSVPEPGLLSLMLAAGVVAMSRSHRRRPTAYIWRKRCR
jgi:hypothetical protein